MSARSGPSARRTAPDASIRYWRRRARPRPARRGPARAGRRARSRSGRWPGRRSGQAPRPGPSPRRRYGPGLQPAGRRLQGSKAPTLASASRARFANGGLQAPRMRYGPRSTPRRALSVACTSISARTPKPSVFRAASTLGRTSAIEPARLVPNVYRLSVGMVDPRVGRTMRSGSGERVNASITCVFAQISASPTARTMGAPCALRGRRSRTIGRCPRWRWIPSSAGTQPSGS